MAVMRDYSRHGNCSCSGGALIVGAISTLLGFLFVIVIIAIPFIIVVGVPTLLILWYMDRRAKRNLVARQIQPMTSYPSEHASLLGLKRHDENEGVYP